MHLNMILVHKKGVKLTKNIIKLVSSEIRAEYPHIKLKEVDHSPNLSIFCVKYQRVARVSLALIDKKEEGISICLSSTFEDYSYLIDITAKLAKKLKRYVCVINPELNDYYKPLEKLLADHQEFNLDFAFDQGGFQR